MCEKIAQEMGRAVGEALVQALAQTFIADAMDPPLAYAETAIFDAPCVAPALFPAYAGVKVARFAFVRLGVGDSPTGLVCRLLQLVSDLWTALWNSVRWHSPPMDQKMRA